MSNCVFNFNILALVLFGILGGSQIYIRGPCAPQRPPSVKILKRAQVLAYVHIVVNFQLRSSIHAGLTERPLYNRFALKNLPKWVFWGILGVGVKIFGGNPPRNAMTADLRRLVKKIMEMLQIPLSVKNYFVKIEKALIRPYIMSSVPKCQALHIVRSCL